MLPKPCKLNEQQQVNKLKIEVAKRPFRPQFTTKNKIKNTWN